MCPHSIPKKLRLVVLGFEASTGALHIEESLYRWSKPQPLHNGTLAATAVVIIDALLFLYVLLMDLFVYFIFIEDLIRCIRHT